jgi:hypothetical protein
MHRLTTGVLAGLLLAVEPGSARDLPAAERLSVCFNYGCVSEADAWLDGATLQAVHERLARAGEASEERLALAEAVAMLYRAAGRQTPIRADRAGNLLDAAVYGRMDCIDHSMNTTRLLRVLEARGWLRFHRVAEPARRTRVLFQHFSAVIEELDRPRGAHSGSAVGNQGAERDAVLLALCDCGSLERAPAEAGGEGSEGSTPEVVAQYVVDSWFVEHGERPVVLPLQDWLRGEGPNVQ